MESKQQSSKVTAEQLESWLIRAVDTLASEYGWSKQDIYYDVYPDELLMLQNAIRNRKAAENYKLAAIALNPKTKNPRELLNVFKSDIDTEPSVSMETKKPAKDSLKVTLEGGGFGVK